MYWEDGTNFVGNWANDQRINGKLIMANGVVYEGDFINDLPHSKNGRFYLP
jgi:hypothetical protein